MSMQTKTEFRYFTIMEYEDEQAYLRRMHNNGWKLSHVSFPGFYRFEACEPEDVVYQLDYNREGASQREEYVQMFRDCGWEYLFDFVGYSYFRKPAAAMDGEEEIFCDDESRLDMMKRVFRGRMVPMLIILACVIVPQLVIWFLNRHSDGLSYALMMLYIALLVLYLAVFASFGLQYRAYRRRLGK